MRESNLARQTIDQLACLNQLERCRRLQICPLEEEFVFGSMYPVKGEHGEAKPIVAIISENDEDRQILLDVILEAPHSHAGPVLMVDGDETASKSLQEGFGPDDLSGFSVISKKNHPLLQRMRLIDFPLSCDPSHLPVLDQVSVIYYVVSLSNPDISSKSRRLLSRMRPLHEKVKLIIMGSQASPRNVGQLIWALSRSLHLAEMPQSYFLDQGESEREDFFTDLLCVPLRYALSQLQLLIREARLARAHALLMSHIKSQLPAFNRQAKQDRICEELTEVISTVSSKSGIPINDFPSTDYIREKIRAFDFSKLKKLKESSIELITEFIDKDAPRLLTLFPQDDLLLIQTASPSLAVPTVNVAAFVEDFEALHPRDGVISGSHVKDHLIFVSKLPSSTLHKIWKLADQDQDGALSLKEYALCRELIRQVQEGHDLPSSLSSI